MARKFLGARPRANSADPSSADVSNPTLTSTNAVPRSDLHPLNNPPSSTAKRSKTFAIPEAHHTQRHTRRHHDAVPPFGQDDIGVALGSPSQAWPQPSGGTLIARADEYTRSPVPNASPGVSLQRKESKWKKFGNLFRSRTEPAMPSNEPLYEVHVNDQSVHSREPSGQSNPAAFVPSPWQPRSHSLPQENQKLDRSGSKHKNRKPHAKLTKEQADPKPDRHWGRLAEEPAQDLNLSSSAQTKLPASTPLLNVDIPEVEMERYSVMFGNLLGKQPSSSTLLARRSKHLEKLKAHTEENEPKHDPLPPPPRLPASPMRAKSPSFTLFPPTAATKASKIQKSTPVSTPVTTQPRPQLKKSNTLPVSPTKSPWDSPNVNPDRYDSPSSTLISHARWDSEVSHLSGAASDGESVADDKTILLRSRPGPVVDENEPSWEFVGPQNKFAPDPARAQSPLARLQREMNSPDFKASPSSSSPKQRHQTPPLQAFFKAAAAPSPPAREPPPAPSPPSASKNSSSSAPHRQSPLPPRSDSASSARSPLAPPSPFPPRSDGASAGSLDSPSKPLPSPFPARSSSRQRPVPASANTYPPPPRSASKQRPQPSNTYPPPTPPPTEQPPAAPVLAPPDSPAMDDFRGEDYRHDSVEISVARSVSVSKRQRKHLVVPAPAQTKDERNTAADPKSRRADSKTREHGHRGGDARGGGGAGVNQHVVERRVGTLTLEALQPGHVHRKSENVVIESA